MNDDEMIWASATEHERTMRPLTVGPHGKGRRRCFCGCGGWKTHVGCANGVGMVSACEFFIRRWVRDPSARAPQP